MKKRTETFSCVQSMKYFACKQTEEAKKPNSVADVDVSDLGPVNLNWFTHLTKEKLQSVKYSQEVDILTPVGNGEGELLDGVGCGAATPSQGELMLSDEWDSPRLPYTWTPASSDLHSPVVVDVASRGSSKSSSPSALAASLGVNLEGSVFSWTSSLETPPCQTPARDNQALGAGEEALLSPGPCLNSINPPKRLPRALFSPSKTTDSDNLGVGLSSTFGEEDDEQDLDETLVKSCLPFSSSPLFTSTHKSAVKQDTGLSNLMSTPHNYVNSSAPNSPGQISLIESTLSDFFDTPASNLRSRRKQAPGKKAITDPHSNPSPVSTGPSTPFSSPLQSILSSEKKVRTPASVKRVRFADDLETRTDSKTSVTVRAETEELAAVKLLLDNSVVPSTGGNSRKISAEAQCKETSELVLGQDITELHSENHVIHMAVVGPEISKSALNNSGGGLTTGLNVVKDAESCLAEFGQKISQKVDDEKRLMSGQDKNVNLTYSHQDVSVSLSTSTDNGVSESAPAEVTDDDMFSQISAEVLNDMCSVHIPEEGKPLSPSDQGLLETETCANSHRETVNVKEPVQTAEVREPDSMCSSSSPVRGHKDEDLFTQISPGLMDSIMDSAKVVEELPCTAGKTEVSRVKTCQASVNTLVNPTNNREMPVGDLHLDDKINASKTPVHSMTKRCRKAKTKQFMYPSPRQINSSCPENVYGFKSGSQRLLAVPVVSTPKAELSRCISLSSPSYRSQPSPSKSIPARITAPECRLSCDVDTPKRREKSRRSSDDFKTFSEMMKDCELDLLDSTFDDPGHGIAKTCADSTATNCTTLTAHVSSSGSIDKSHTQEDSRSDPTVTDSLDMNRSNTTHKYTIPSLKNYDSSTEETASKQSSRLCDPTAQIGEKAKVQKLSQIPEVTPAHRSSGFQTASGREFKLSANSLRRAQSLISECLLDQDSLASHSDKSVELVKSNDNIIQARERAKVPELGLTKEITSAQGSAGFQTASGRECKLSESSLKRAQSLIAECGSDQDLPPSHSDKSVAESKNSPNSGDTLSCRRERAMFPKLGLTPVVTSAQGSSGFQTASGIELKLSKNSLKRAQSLIAECGLDQALSSDHSDNSVQPLKSNNSVNSSTKAQSRESVNALELRVIHKVTDGHGSLGFQTASGRKFNPSESSMKRAQSLIAECLSDQSLPTSHSVESAYNKSSLKDELATTKASSSGGFTTAGGKDVKVSSESIAKALSLLEESGRDVPKEDFMNIRDEVQDTNMPPSKIMATHLDSQYRCEIPFSGFKTASGKDFVVCKESLEKAKALIEERNTDSVPCLDSNQLRDAANANSLPQIVPINSAIFEQEMNPGKNNGMKLVLSNGFTTAAGKNVQVCRESLTKARQLMEDSGDKTGVTHTGTSSSTSFPVFSLGGFSTAAGKDIAISKDKLDKAQALIEDSDDLSTGVKCTLVNETLSNSGKSITVLDKVANVGVLDGKTYPEPESSRTLRGKASRQEAVPSPLCRLEHISSTIGLNRSKVVDKNSAFSSNGSFSNHRRSVSASVSPKVNMNVPKGFRPFKPPRITPKKETKNECLNVDPIPNKDSARQEITPADQQTSLKTECEYELKETTHNNRSFDDSIADEDLCAHLSTFDDKTIESEDVTALRNKHQSSTDPKKEQIKGLHEVFSNHKCLDAVFAGDMVDEVLEEISHAEDAINMKASTLSHEKDSRNVAISLCPSIQSVPSNEFDHHGDLDDTLLEAMMVDITTAVSTGTSPCVSASESSLKRSRPASFSDDEAFQSDLERLPKEMKITIMPADLSKVSGSRKETVEEHSGLCDVFHVGSGKVRVLDKTNSTSSLFQTASGKTVDIAEKFLQKARECLGEDTEDVQDSTTVPANRKVKAAFAGNNLFQTASGKAVNISEKALLEAKAQLCVNEIDEPVCNQALDPTDVNTEATSCNNFALFQAASVRPVMVSEKSLQKAKGHLMDAEDKTNGTLLVKAPDAHMQKQGLIQSGMVEGNCFFQTASGKDVSVSENALQEARGHLSEVRVEKFDLPAPKSVFHPGNHVMSESAKLQGNSLFQTASGKAVSVSDKALQEAQAHLSDDGSGKAEVTLSTLPHSSGKPQSRSLFQTASGKNVIISEKSLQEAKAHLSETENGTCDMLEAKLSAQQMSDCSILPGKTLFQTASGKHVNVSEKSLREAKAHLSEMGESDKLPGKSLFQTASGKPVNVSEKSLQEGKAHLSEMGEFDKLPGKSLFQTASGKHVNVSEKSLQEAKAHLSVMGESDKLPGKSLFQTTSVKHVNVSEKSLQEAKAHLSEMGESDKLPGKSLFQTASGKHVNVSEKSLQEAKAHLSVMGECDKLPGKSLFQTASGKHVNVSEKSLLEAKAHLSETGESDKLPGQNLFQTASRKNVKVSKKALEEAKANLWETGEVICKNTVNPSSESRLSRLDCVDPVQNHCLFQTASGNSVSVSAQALLDAKRHLADMSNKPNSTTGQKSDDQVRNTHSKKNLSTSSGSIFQTSSGKPVSVSDEALLAARQSITNDKLFQNDQRHSGAQTSTVTGKTMLDTIYSPQASETSNVAMRRKLPGIVYKPQSSGPTFTSLNSSVGIRKGDDSAFTGLTESRSHPNHGRLDENQHSSNDVRVVHRSGAGSIYRRAPKFSTPEASFRDHPYRRGHKFLPSRCSEQEFSSSLSSEDNQINAGSIPVCVPLPASSFKTPYKTRNVQAKSSDKPNRTDEQSGLPDAMLTFTPFISDPGGVESNLSGSKVVTFSPKHVPTCSGDSGTLSDNGSKNAVQNFSPVKPNDSGAVRQGASLSRCVLTEETVACLQMARLQQDKIISRQKRKTIRPCAGKLMALKKCTASGHKMKLKDVLQTRPVHSGGRPRKVQSVPKSVLTVSSRTAEGFRFDLSSHYGAEILKQGNGVLVGDGIWLLPADDCSAGKEEFYRSFISHENVDPLLISEDWLFNHYRWVVWKLAAYEVFCPQFWAGRCLTPDMVMLQLKYRYDREIDNCQRPALRKILEHDDTPGKRMVLCVSDVITCGGGDGSEAQGTATPSKPQPSQVELELTDGWYAIRACIDTPLQELIKAGKVQRGDKLVMCGAELTGSEEPANPLQAPSAARLKLSANSTRKARWDTTLGYQPDPRPFPLSLSSLLAGGGTVPAVDVVVVRVYPKMYFEKLGDGRSVFRNARAEQKADTAYRRKSERLMEQLYSKVQQELELQEEKNNKGKMTRSRSKRRLKACDIECLCTGQEVYEAVSTSLEPHTIEMSLSGHQMALYQEHRQKLMEEKRQQLQADFQKALKEKQKSEPVRNVVPLIKIRVAGCHLLDVDAKLTCLLTIWRPAEDVLSLLTEGRKLRLYNVTVTAARSRLASCDIQISATRSTRYQEMSIDENFLDQLYEPREVLLVQNLMQQAPPAYSEVDFVGIVLKIETSDLQSERGLQSVYVVDPQGGLAVIRVWGGVQSLDLEEVLTCGRCFVGSNLLYRGRRWKQLVTFDISTEITYFTQSPASRLFQARLSLAQAKIKDAEYMRKAYQSLEDIIGQPLQGKHENGSAHVASPVTPRTDLLSRSASRGVTSPQTPDDATQDARKSLLQSKCAKLARYSGAPPLSPLNTPISRTARKAFRPPRRQSTPQ